MATNVKTQLVSNTDCSLSLSSPNPSNQLHRGGAPSTQRCHGGCIKIISVNNTIEYIGSGHLPTAIHDSNTN